MTASDVVAAVQQENNQVASGQLEDPNTLRRTRRDLARLKTVLHERHLAAQAVKKEGN